MATATAPQHLFAQMLDRVRAAAAPLVGANADLGRIVVEPPRDPSHGDLATNAAMLLAKPLGENPRALAVRIAAAIAEDTDVEAADVAGPGFINLRLKKSTWQNALRAVLAAGSGYGRSDIGGGKKINVEFVSANPTGPMHV